MHYRRIINQKGDTIVEVLIAVAVVSSVLVGAFATSNLSLKQIRSAQERTEAQKIAQSYVEKMQYVYNRDVSSIRTSPSAYSGTFCVIDSIAPPPAPYFSIVPSSNVNCTVAPRYRVAISQDNTNLRKFRKFNITVTWDSLRGLDDTVTINYVVGPR